MIPEIQGLLTDAFGYQKSLIIVLLCYAYLIYFALSGQRNVEEVTRRIRCLLRVRWGVAADSEEANRALCLSQDARHCADVLH